MGRKPSAAKNAEKAHAPENAHPSLERVEPQPGNGNIKLSEVVDYRLENQHPQYSPLKYPNSSVDGVGMHHERIPAQEQVHPEYELQKKSPASRRKNAKYNATFVRRSERIKSAVVRPSNHGIECFEEVTVIESEKDEPATQMEEVLPETEPEPELEPEENLNDKCLNEKVDYALQRLECLEKIVELLKAKVDENIGLDETSYVASFSYRTMYIDSQKKIEALTDENQRLTGKLEYALGKIEVYEKENRVLIEVLDKMKDATNAVVISNLTKTTEAAVNASTQAIRNACPTSAAKRRRNAQDT